MQTVASCCISISAIGLPTMLLAPTTTTLRPCDRDLLVLEQLLHAERRAGREHGVAGDQAADVVEVEAVDVLLHRDALEHMRHVDMRRQRQLHQDAVHRRIGVERIDARQQLRSPASSAGMWRSSERMPVSLQALILLRT